MKLTVHITPDDSLTEADFAELRRRAAEEHKTPDEWAAGAIRRALNAPKPPASQQPDAAGLAA